MTIIDILGDDFLVEDADNLLGKCMILDLKGFSADDKEVLEDYLFHKGLDPFHSYDCLLCKADLMTVCKLAWSYAIEIGTKRCHGMELPCVTIIKIESND